MLREAPGPVERPSLLSCLILRVSQNHPAQLDELFLGKILCKVRVWHRQLVPRYISHIHRAVQNVRVLGGAEYIDSGIGPALAGKKKQITDGNIPIARNYRELRGTAIRVILTGPRKQLHDLVPERNKTDAGAQRRDFGGCVARTAVSSSHR